MSSYQKRRKPNFYNAQKSKKRREFVLKPGLVGFLCTCNNRERDCIRESYNILNEYADILYGEEKAAVSEEAAAPASASTTDPETCGNGSEEEDIETALNKELSSLKALRTKHPNMRRFQVVESGANNCIFIQTTLPNPVELVHHIMKDLESTKKQKTRFLLRLIPIEVTCKAYLEDIRHAADSLFDKYFTKEGKSFAILFNRRNSSGVNRDDLIHDLADMVLRRHPDNKADLKHPQLAILVELIRNMCCISVLPDYFELRKYNLLELCSPEGGIKITDGKEMTSDSQDMGRKGEGDADSGGGGGGEKSNANIAEASSKVANEIVGDGKGDNYKGGNSAINIDDKKGDSVEETASKIRSEKEDRETTSEISTKPSSDENKHEGDDSGDTNT